jgi:hypothetical protein
VPSVEAFPWTYGHPEQSHNVLTDAGATFTKEANQRGASGKEIIQYGMCYKDFKGTVVLMSTSSPAIILSQNATTAPIATSFPLAEASSKAFPLSNPPASSLLADNGNNASPETAASTLQLDELARPPSLLDAVSDEDSPGSEYGSEYSDIYESDVGQPNIVVVEGKEIMKRRSNKTGLLIPGLLGKDLLLDDKYISKSWRTMITRTTTKPIPKVTEMRCYLY